mmetsp:Transcript_21673/g.60164  ORF Transcript_21673/g.60164 Transcript_21673/m.60164 type:complete len:766 (+) Transcript_21673:138-2435(+)
MGQRARTTAFTRRMMTATKFIPVAMVWLQLLLTSHNSNLLLADAFSSSTTTTTTNTRSRNAALPRLRRQQQQQQRKSFSKPRSSSISKEEGPEAATLRTITTASVAAAVTATTLFSTLNNNNNPSSSSGKDGNNKKNKNLSSLLRSCLIRLATLRTRFAALGRRAKRWVLLQTALVLFVVTGFLRTVVLAPTTTTAAANRMLPPPVEVSYGRFLSLLDQQSQHTHKQQQLVLKDNVPYVDHVTIGPDKIYFNIYRQQEQAAAAATAPQSATTTSGDRAAKALRPAPEAGATVVDDSTVNQPAMTYQTKKIFPGVYMTKEVPAPEVTQPTPLAAAATTTANSDAASKQQDNKQLSVIRAYTRQLPSTTSPELLAKLKQHQIGFSAMAMDATSATTTAKSSNALGNVLRTAMAAFYCLILWRFYRTLSNATGNQSSDSPGKLANDAASDLPLASFEDIQGMDDVKLEVMELVDTLRHPNKYAILGARAPTGLLLEGPPGTGKTMLARATAASVGVPLLYCSGSDFVEMFVGRGAARVRKLFERATKLSPCIIFIDELDALGKSRDMGGGGPFGGGYGRANDEAEQTLNQLLACMDGLDSTRRICVMAATNRKEVLDPALLRPGRLDRIVKLKLPDAAGREKILRVHCQKLPGFSEGQGVDTSRPNSLGKGKFVDLSAIAAITNGLSGAELEFIVNEAAIRAVRRVTAELRTSANGLTTKITVAGRDGDTVTEKKIVPHVEPIDFEESVQNFFQTRRKGGSNGWFGSL